jgi:hypothetical protein
VTYGGPQHFSFDMTYSVLTCKFYERLQIIVSYATLMDISEYIGTLSLFLFVSLCYLGFVNKCKLLELSLSILYKWVNPFACSHLYVITSYSIYWINTGRFTPLGHNCRR